MLLKDGFKAMFRGGFSLWLSKQILDLGNSLSEITYFQYEGWRYLTPSALIASQLAAHPLMVISARVMYNQSNGTDKNMFKCIKNIFKHHGFMGFYRGFVPITILTVALRYEHFYFMLY